MGIFDFFFGEDKNESSNDAKNDKSYDYTDFESIKRKTEILRKENKKWQSNFNSVLKLREKALKLEKEGRLLEAIELYVDSISTYENNSQLNIYNYAADIDRVIVLLGKTKQKERLKEFLEEKIGKHSSYNRLNAWEERLSKLSNSSKKEVKSINPIDIQPQTGSNPTLGKQMLDFKRSMPEFNFYFDIPEGSTQGVVQVSFNLSKKLNEFRQAFNNLKSKAKIAENEGNYKIAIETYEKMIAEECEDAEPYERLIIIYSKLKWRSEEISVIERAISFFTELREEQLCYVNYLATKYGVADKVQMFIDQNKKIYYYSGVFELYNPQTVRLDKWNKRLSMLMKK